DHPPPYPPGSNHLLPAFCERPTDLKDDPPDSESPWVRYVPLSQPASAEGPPADLEERANPQSGQLDPLRLGTRPAGEEDLDDPRLLRVEGSHHLAQGPPRFRKGAPGYLRDCAALSIYAEF